MKTRLLPLILMLPSLILAQKSDYGIPERTQEIKKIQAQINLRSLTSKDREKIKRIRELYTLINLDSALYYSGLELKLATKTEEWNLIADAKLSRAKIYSQQQEPDAALQLLLENVANKRKISDSILASTYYRMAKVEIQKQRPAESVDYVLKATPIFKQLNDSANLAECYAHIAGVYTFILAEPTEAIPYFEKALRYAPASDHRIKIQTNINLSSAYVNNSDFENAIEKNQVAERISHETNYPYFFPSIYVQYAFIYHRFGKYQKSLEYALLADAEIQKMPDLDHATQDKIHWYLGLSYKDLKQHRKAIYYFEELSNSLYVDRALLQTYLIELYAEVGDFEYAFRLQEKLLDELDSSDLLARNQQVVDIVEKYESEKKQEQIKALNAEKIRQKQELTTSRFILYGTIAFFLVILIVGAFWYRTRAKLKQTELSLSTTQLQQRFLRTQLNPHFLFHALTSIETYIYKNDKMKSAEFLRGFSVLMRQILDFSDVDFITLEQDIEFIKKYIKLQQLNHEFKFECEIKVAPELELDQLQIPPMLIQPAVENAILHGALNTTDGRISIDYSKVGNQFQISITDNGKETKNSGSSANRLHRSMSLDITQARIKNLQEVHGILISYQPYDPSRSENGSTVTFRLPL